MPLPMGSFMAGEVPSVGVPVTEDEVARTIKRFEKSPSAGLVQNTVICESPGLVVASVTLAGERLSIVNMLALVSEPACALALVSALIKGERSYSAPGGDDIAAWVLGVTRILNWVWVVLAGMGVPPLKLNVLLEGLEIAVKYVVAPSLLVMRTSERP